MRQPLHRFLGHLFVLGVVGIAVPGVPRLVSASAATTSDAAPHAAEGFGVVPDEVELALDLPEDVQRVVASDMAVDWVGGAPDGVEDAMLASPAPADHRAPHGDGEGVEHAAAISGGDDGSQHHAAAAGGYALFSDTARWLPSGYTIRLTGGDGRIEQYRDEIHAAASAAARLTGVPFHVNTAFGGPANPSRGEIAVVLGSGPCGGGAIGCGGPTLTPQEVLAGRVWLHPAALDLSATHRASLAAHELGHALGLQHYDGAWTDGRQVMYPRLSEVTSYRSGDGSGLRVVAGSADRPAGGAASGTPLGRLGRVTGSFETIRVRGWAIDPETAAAVRVQVRRNGELVATVPADRPRGDLGSLAGQYGPNHGFDVDVPASAGRNRICVRVLGVGSGGDRGLGCAEVVHAVHPIGVLDGARADGLGVRIHGWALDPNTPEPISVVVHVDGEVAPVSGSTVASADRPDVALQHPAHGPRHGFSHWVPLTPGRHTVCVTAQNVGLGADRRVGCAEVGSETQAAATVAVVDSLTATAGDVLAGS